MVNDERSGDPGTSPSPSGSGDNGDGVAEPTTGLSTDSSGGGPDGGHRGSKSPERVKWAGIAGAFVTVVILIAQLYGQVSGNTDRSDQIIEKVQQLPDVVNKVEDIKDATADLKDQIKDQPTPMSTTIIQKGQPGKPGEPGKPGQVVTSPPRTRVITTPGPTTTIKPSPQPTCNTKLIGTCIVP